MERMTREEIEHAVYTQLGQDAPAYNVHSIADNIIAVYGYVESLGALRGSEFWSIAGLHRKASR